MIPELGKYAGAVLSAYGLSLVLIAGIVAVSVVRARRVARALNAAREHPDG